MSDYSVAVIDYDMGNVWSVISAFKFLGVEADLVGDPKSIAKYKFIVLPGVGSFRKGMEALKERRLDDAIYNAVKDKNTKLLGICLGMQLLGSHGSEDGDADGLGLVDNKVERFTSEELGQNKIPHVGFNPVEFNETEGLFKDIQKKSDFYFTHSYRMMFDGMEGRYGLCQYGASFLASFELDNICGTQFHPEKSQSNGLVLLKNFLEL